MMNRLKRILKYVSNLFITLLYFWMFYNSVKAELKLCIRKDTILVQICFCHPVRNLEIGYNPIKICHHHHPLATNVKKYVCKGIQEITTTKNRKGTLV
jgi:hypothetical protein